jgi:pseudouridine-5'-phosphate glycosidase
VATEVALSADDMEAVLHTAEKEAVASGVRGPALTPFLLAKLAELTKGRTLRTNQALVIANARLAVEVAVELARP